MKDASEAFAKGLKLQREKRQDQAFDQFETAARLAPKDVDYLTARELTRQQLVFDHLERGNAEMSKGRQIEALAEFRTALHLDPQNEFARQRLNDAMGEWSPKTAAAPQVIADSGEIRVSPVRGPRRFSLSRRWPRIVDPDRLGLRRDRDFR